MADQECYLAADVPDPQACIAACRRRNVSSRTLEELCEALSDSRRSSNSIHCCESQLCQVDNLGAKGRDPDVNWLINACQNIGNGQDSRSTMLQPPVLFASKTPAPTKPFTSQEPSETIRPSMAGLHLAVASLTTATPESTTTSIRSLTQRPSLAASLVLSEASAKAKATSGLSTGLKVTIALSTIVGVGVMLALVLWHLRLRRRTRQGRGPDIDNGIKGHGVPAVPDSPTALVSPSSSSIGPNKSPLTPPPRLQERKFLFPASNKRNWPLHDAKGPDWAGYLDSSVRTSATTATELVQWSPQAKSDDVAACPPPSSRPQLIVHTGGQKAHNSTRSALNMPSTANSAASIALAGQDDSTPTASPRTRRQYYIPLQVAGLASPGPPPNRALPSTPVMPPPRRHGDTDAAIGVASQIPPQVASLPSESNHACDTTGEHAQQSHCSRGGRGGGGPGVAASSPRWARDGNSPVLDKGDLQRLGGSHQ